MAGAARRVAIRLTAEEGTGPGTLGGRAAIHGSPARHLPAELRATALPTAAEETAQKSYIGIADPIY